MTQLRTETDRRAFVESSCRFDSVTGGEAPHQEWFRDRLDDFGFETYTWTGDAERLAEHPSFPDDPAEIDTADRPSVGGVLSFGDPDAGPTLVLNGHCDVVPVHRESWSSPPFEPTWDEAGERLTCRGAADMKAGLGACVAAALALRDRVDDGAASLADTASTDGEETPDDATTLDGRVVVESVVDEEAGGIGAATAALSNPYPFERDAVVVAEPTELRPVTATEGSLMKRLRLRGRSAHAATRWRGESVLPHFRAIHDAVEAFGAERAETVTHPLYERFDDPWPVNVGRVEAGSWASSVPATLTAEFRIGVAPGESVAAVEAAVDERVAAVAAERPWLAEHPPTFERFSVQFEPAETDPDAPVVRHLRDAMGAAGLEDTDPVGATYGADSRHYVAAGIPAVCFGPGSIEQAHFPDEHVAWSEVETAREVLTETAARFLASES